MPYERHVLHFLNAHHAEKCTVFFVPPEHDARIHLMPEIFPRHIGLMPAVCWDDAVVCLSSVVYDREDGFEISTITFADHIVLFIEINPYRFEINRRLKVKRVSGFIQLKAAP